MQCPCTSAMDIAYLVLVACFFVLQIIQETWAKPKSLVPLAQISPKQDSSELRRVLFGGEPHLSFCMQKSNPSLGGFLDKVREKLGDASSAVRTAFINCGEKLPTSGKTLGKTLKLKSGQPGEPTVIWSVNGEPPKQLPLKVYTSPVLDKRKSRKSTERDGVQLNATRLANYVLKRENAKVTPVSSHISLEKHCYSHKYQLCILVLHSGKLTDKDKRKVERLADLHRNLRFLTIDLEVYELESLPGVAGTKRITLKAIRRKDYSFVGPRNEIDLETERVENEKRMERLKEPVETSPIGPKLRVSDSLQMLAESGNIYMPEQRLTAFRQGELESTEEFIKKGDLKSLQFLYRSGSKGFILGAEEVLKYLVQKEAFGESLTEKDLAELQKEFFVDTLRGKRKKTKALKDLRYLAYEGEWQNQTALADFLSFAATVKDDEFILLRRRPKLHFKKKVHTQAKSIYKKTKSTTYTKKRQESQAAREKQRRYEMEQEALQSGAIALEANEKEDENCDASSQDEREEGMEERAYLHGQEDNIEEIELDEF